MSKARIIGIISLFIGIGALITGILLKRIYHQPPHQVFTYHSIGGVLLMVGISLCMLTREPPPDK